MIQQNKNVLYERATSFSPHLFPVDALSADFFASFLTSLPFRMLDYTIAGLKNTPLVFRTYCLYSWTSSGIISLTYLSLKSHQIWKGQVSSCFAKGQHRVLLWFPERGAA